MKKDYARIPGGQKNVGKLICYWMFLKGKRKRENSPIFISKDGENTHTVVCGSIITRPIVQYILQWVCWSL